MSKYENLQADNASITLEITWSIPYSTFSGSQSFFSRLFVVPIDHSSSRPAFAVAGNLIQHRPLLSLDPIKPKFSKINPLEGAKRLFSRDALVNFVKGLLKLGVVSAVLWFVMAPEFDRLEATATLDVAAILADFMELSMKIFGAVLAIVTIIAIADYVYQRNRWWSRLKMTVQETRDEYKQQEGDPKVKGRIRQIRMERSRKRMMAAVPQATEALWGGLIDPGDIQEGDPAGHLLERPDVARQVVSGQVEVIPEARGLCHVTPPASRGRKRSRAV